MTKQIVGSLLTSSGALLAAVSTIHPSVPTIHKDVAKLQFASQQITTGAVDSKEASALKTAFNRKVEQIDGLKHEDYADIMTADWVLKTTDALDQHAAAHTNGHTEQMPDGALQEPRAAVG